MFKNTPVESILKAIRSLVTALVMTDARLRGFGTAACRSCWTSRIRRNVRDRRPSACISTTNTRFCRCLRKATELGVGLANGISATVGAGSSALPRRRRDSPPRTIHAAPATPAQTDRARGDPRRPHRCGNACSNAHFAANLQPRRVRIRLGSSTPAPSNFASKISWTKRRRWLLRPFSTTLIRRTPRTRSSQPAAATAAAASFKRDGCGPSHAARVAAVSVAAKTSLILTVFPSRRASLVAADPRRS